MELNIFTRKTKIFALSLLMPFFLIFSSCVCRTLSTRNLDMNNAELYLLNFSDGEVTLTLDGTDKTYLKNTQDFSKIDETKAFTPDSDYRYVYFYDDYADATRGFELTEEDKVTDIKINESHEAFITKDAEKLYSFTILSDKEKINLECYCDYPSLLDEYIGEGKFIFSSRPGDFLLVKCQAKSIKSDSDWINPKFIIVIAPESE